MRLTDWLMVGITIILCGIGFLFMLRDMRKHPLSKASETEGEGKIHLPVPLIIYSIIMVIITVGIALMMCFVYVNNTFLFSLKRIALLSLLWPIGYIDFKSYRIPNAFILLGLAYRIIILLFELLLGAENVWMTLLSEGIAAVALVFAAFLCTLIIKNSVGFGDIKLFAVMGLMLSLTGIWSAIFATLIVSFIVSIVLLLTKKKTRKDTIPFGPAIVFGTYLSIFLTGM